MLAERIGGLRFTGPAFCVLLIGLSYRRCPIRLATLATFPSRGRLNRSGEAATFISNSSFGANFHPQSRDAPSHVLTLNPLFPKEATMNSILYLTIFLGVMSAMAPLSTDMYLPSLPEISSAFDISTSMTQLTLTMTMVGMAVGQILGGPVSDRLGRKVPLLMMVNGLAPIAAPVAGAQVLRFTDWHGIFIFLVGIGLVQMGLTMHFKETLKKGERVRSFTEGFAAFAVLVRNRYFFGQCLLQCFYFGAFFSYIAGSVFLFQNIYGVSPQVYSYIFGGIGLGLMLMGVLPAKMAGAVAEITFLKAALIVPFVMSLFFLAGIVLDAPIGYTLPVLFLTIVPLSVMGAASTSLSLSRCGKNAGSASALLGFFNMILGGALMPLTGIAGDHSALPMGIIMALCYALSLALVRSEKCEVLARRV